MPTKEIGVSSEKCVCCLNVLGDGNNRTVRAFEFLDKVSQKAFMEMHNFNATSQICVSCITTWDGYNPTEFVYNSAKNMKADEIAEYLSQDDNLVQLIKTDGGLELLSELDSSVGYNILKEAFNGQDTHVQHDVMSVAGWMEKLAKIRNDNGNTALHELAYKNMFAALWLVSCSSCLELAIKTKTSGGNTVLHEAMKNSPAAVFMVNTETGREILLKTVDGWKHSAFSTAMRWPVVSSFIVTLPGWMERLAKAREGVAGFRSLLSQSIAFHPEIAVEITKIPGWLDILNSLGDKVKGEVLQHMVKHSEKAAMEITTIPGWMELLAGIRAIGDNGGNTALHDAALHEKVALKMLESLKLQGIPELLVKTRSEFRNRAVLEIMMVHPTVARAVEKIELRISTHNDDGVNVYRVTGSSLETKTTETSDNGVMNNF